MLSNQPRRRRRRLSRWGAAVLLLALWTLLVLYPNPLRLGQSLYRLAQPPIDPGAVAHLLPELPAEPVAIDRFVAERFPYRYDWQTAGVPWYFPTTAEAVARGSGDCKTQFLILASIFEALSIPYEKHYSVSHFWISYAGKPDLALENPTSALFARDKTGAGRWQWPDWAEAEVWQVFRDAFWQPMPPIRKWLLCGGWLVIVAAALWPRRRAATA